MQRLVITASETDVDFKLVDQAVDDGLHGRDEVAPRQWNWPIDEVDAIAECYWSEIPDHHDSASTLAERVFSVLFGGSRANYHEDSVTVLQLHANSEGQLKMLRNLPFEHAAVGEIANGPAVSLRGPSRWVVRSGGKYPVDDGLVAIDEIRRVRLWNDVKPAADFYRQEKAGQGDVLSGLTDLVLGPAACLALYAHGQWARDENSKNWAFWFCRDRDRLSGQELRRQNRGITVRDLVDTWKNGPPQIVFLGVCDAGSAEKGADSAAQQLLDQGVKVVVAPNRSVDQDDAIRIGEAFVEALRSRTVDGCVLKDVERALRWVGGSSMLCQDFRASAWTIHTNLADLTLPGNASLVPPAPNVGFVVRGDQIGSCPVGAATIWGDDIVSRVDGDANASTVLVLSPDGDLQAVGGSRGSVEVFVLDHLTGAVPRPLTMLDGGGIPLAVARRGHTGVRCITRRDGESLLWEWDPLTGLSRSSQLPTASARSACFVGGRWAVVDVEGIICAPDLPLNGMTGIRSVHTVATRHGDRVVLLHQDGSVRTMPSDPPFRETRITTERTVSTMWVAPDIRRRSPLSAELVVQTDDGRLARLCLDGELAR